MIPFPPAPPYSPPPQGPSCPGCPCGAGNPPPPPPYSDYRDRPFDYESFVALFPEFGDTSTFPQALVEIAGKNARLYVTDQSCPQLDGPDRAYAQSLMTAHLVVLAIKRSANPLGQPTPGGGSGSSATGGTAATSSIGVGAGVGVITSASVGGVSVSMQLPQSATAWEYWLNQTPYGQELLAYLSAHVPAGIYGYGSDIRVLR